MSVLYAESSAVLAWLLGEPVQDAIVDVLAASDEVATSALTVLECARGLLRARASRRITAAEESAAGQMLDDVLESWQIVTITPQVLSIARRAFPREPVRSLDAIHLASARTLSRALGALDVLSLDARVRDNARALGMRVLPA